MACGLATVSAVFARGLAAAIKGASFQAVSGPRPDAGLRRHVAAREPIRVPLTGPGPGLIGAALGADLDLCLTVGARALTRLLTIRDMADRTRVLLWPLPPKRQAPKGSLREANG